MDIHKERLQEAVEEKLAGQQGRDFIGSYKDEICTAVERAVTTIADIGLRGYTEQYQSMGDVWDTIRQGHRENPEGPLYGTMMNQPAQEMSSALHTIEHAVFQAASELLEPGEKE